MRFVLYTHSLVSDWNHGNAHFLRGVLGELQAMGHTTLALEPERGWSRSNLLAEAGASAIDRFGRDFPELRSRCYAAGFDHEAALSDADVVIVHEWTDPALVAEIGALRRGGARFTLLFHDTHHRGVSDAHAIAGLALADYDAVLAFGETLRERYLAAGWGSRVFTWHEAADTARFHPIAAIDKQADLIWIGNWGDGERERELSEFLIEPARALRLSGIVHGVRYPETALAALGEAGLDHGGWIANADAPHAFARHRMTVHVPRRPYVQLLPGIPTIRMFEALACGVPLVSAPWRDSERLFRDGVDFLFAADEAGMRKSLAVVRDDAALRASLVAHGLETIRARHTCAHRVDELMEVLKRLDALPSRASVPPEPEFAA